MTITNDNFQKEVVQNGKPVLIDFWASWCGPCKMLAPIIDQLEDEYQGKVTIGKVNVDDQSELAMQFSIMSIPTLIIFKNGEVVEKMVGSRGKADIARVLDKYI